MTVILRKQSLFFDYDNDLSIDALEDARLQSFVPLLCRMYTIENDIEHIEIMLKTGGVSSPRIKNKEESFYLKSEGLTGQNKTIDWTTKK